MARKSVLLNPKVMSLEDHTLLEGSVPVEPEILDVELTVDSDDFCGMGSTLDTVQVQLSELEPKLHEAETRAVALENYYNLLCKQEQSGYYVSKESFDLTVKTLRLGFEAVERMETPENDDDILEGEFERTDTNDAEDGDSGESDKTKDGKPKLSSRIWATLKKIWQWIKETTIKAIEWIQGYWEKFTDNLPKLKERMVAVAKKCEGLAGDEVLELKAPDVLCIKGEFVGDSAKTLDYIATVLYDLMVIRTNVKLIKAVKELKTAGTQGSTEELIKNFSYESKHPLPGDRVVSVSIEEHNANLSVAYGFEVEPSENPENVEVKNLTASDAKKILEVLWASIDYLIGYPKTVKELNDAIKSVIDDRHFSSDKTFADRNDTIKIARAYLIGNQKLSQYVIKFIKAELAVLETLCSQIGNKEEK